jgi:Fic family protein
MTYNWQQNDWRMFEFDEKTYSGMALEFMNLAGQGQGFLSGLSEDNKDESIITILVKEAIKTSEIEGELISRADVVSSIRRNLGYETATFRIKDKRSEGIAKLLVKSRESFDVDLSEKMLFEWHQLLMLGNNQVGAGQWRTHSEAMQVVSGAMGKEKVHFEAPSSDIVAKEMRLFIEWFNDTKPNAIKSIENLLIRTAIAHLYFESIHPFEDGNGRIGRVIAEKALAQGLNKPILMSLSTAIEANKKAYYEALQKAQRSNQIDSWIKYFVEVILQAQKEFNQSITFLLKKSKFFDKNRPILNEHQLKVIKRMLDEGEDGFIGGLNARKYQAISQLSKATATRHLQDLVEKGILISKGGGRSVNYQVNLD